MGPDLANAIPHCQMHKKLVSLLDLCVSSLCRGHASLLCIVPPREGPVAEAPERPCSQTAALSAQLCHRRMWPHSPGNVSPQIWPRGPLCPRSHPPPCGTCTDERAVSVLCVQEAEWRSGQRVGLITQRSQDRNLAPLSAAPRRPGRRSVRATVLADCGLAGSAMSPTRVGTCHE